MSLNKTVSDWLDWLDDQKLVDPAKPIGKQPRKAKVQNVDHAWEELAKQEEEYRKRMSTTKMANDMFGTFGASTWTTSTMPSGTATWKTDFNTWMPEVEQANVVEENPVYKVGDIGVDENGRIYYVLNNGTKVSLSGEIFRASEPPKPIKKIELTEISVDIGL